MDMYYTNTLTIIN